MTDWHKTLLAEHRETERLLALLHEHITTSAWEEADALYEHLAEDLLRHFALEEQSLFPVLSQYRTMLLMEAEHDDLLVLQQRFATELDASVSTCSATVELLPRFYAFMERLAGHIKEEEMGIFPLAEKVLDLEDKLKVERLFAEHTSLFRNTPATLLRPVPSFRLREGKISETSDKPIAIQTLFEREHSSIQHIRLKAGQALNRHWAAQHQCLVMLSGRIIFQTDEESFPIESGQVLELDSRLYFSLQAETDAHLLAFKVWPHPHYTKSVP